MDTEQVLKHPSIVTVINDLTPEDRSFFQACTTPAQVVDLLVSKGLIAEDTRGTVLRALTLPLPPNTGTGATPKTKRKPKCPTCHKEECVCSAPKMPVNVTLTQEQWEDLAQGSDNKDDLTEDADSGDCILGQGFTPHNQIDQAQEGQPDDQPHDPYASALQELIKVQKESLMEMREMRKILGKMYSAVCEMQPLLKETTERLRGVDLAGAAYRSVNIGASLATTGFRTSTLPPMAVAAGTSSGGSSLSLPKQPSGFGIGMLLTPTTSITTSSRPPPSTTPLADFSNLFAKK